jgi:hypothetical protein
MVEIRIEKTLDIELGTSRGAAGGVAGGVKRGTGQESSLSSRSDSSSENSRVETLDRLDSLRVKLEFVQDDEFLVALAMWASGENLKAGSSPPPDKRR